MDSKSVTDGQINILVRAGKSSVYNRVYIDIPGTTIDLPGTMVDLPCTMVDLPGTLVDISGNG